MLRHKALSLHHLEKKILSRSNWKNLLACQRAIAHQTRERKAKVVNSWAVSQEEIKSFRDTSLRNH